MAEELCLTDLSVNSHLHPSTTCTTNNNIGRDIDSFTDIEINSVQRYLLLLLIQMKDFVKWKEDFLSNRDDTQIQSRSSSSFSMVFFYASAFNVMSKIPFDEMKHFLSQVFSRAFKQINEISLQNEINGRNDEISLLKELGEKTPNIAQFVLDLDNLHCNELTILELYSYLMKMKWFYMNCKRICLSVSKQSNRIQVCQAIIEMFLKETCRSSRISSLKDKCVEIIHLTRYALFKHLLDDHGTQFPMRKISEEHYQEMMSILELLLENNYSVIHQMFILIVTDSQDLAVKSLCTQFSRFKSTLPFQKKTWFSQDYKNFERLSHHQNQKRKVLFKSILKRNFTDLTFKFQN